jgi:Flp pilus assembly protein TadG
MVVLLAITGLAIDGGISYGVKAKLSSAVDAAALAAADATGNSSGGYAAAKTAGTQRFYANYHSTGVKYLDSTPSAPAITVQPDTPSAGEIQVTVTASATAPTHFMQVLGLNQVSASSTAQAVKHDLDMVLVIDNTGSLASVGSSVRDAAKSFIDRFNPSMDRIGLVKFAEGAVITDPIRTSGRGFDKLSIDNHISSMSFNGSTNYSEAFYQARAQLDSVTTPSSLRVIVFFSDGSPNSFTSTFAWGSAPTKGVICSPDNNPGNPFGLYQSGVLDSSLPGRYQNPIYSHVTNLPNYFNLGAGIGDGIYHVANPPSGIGMVGRPVNVTNYTSDSPSHGFIDVNNAARNLPEEMANSARASGIYVFTLGEGPELTMATSWSGEQGSAVLINMANDTSAHLHSASQPTGAYVYAPDETQLDAAFQEMASKLLRLTR